MKLTDSMPESEKLIFDIVGVWTLFGVFADILPHFVLLLTGVWTLIRIWETETVRAYTGRAKDVKKSDSE